MLWLIQVHECTLPPRGCWSCLVYWPAHSPTLFTVLMPPLMLRQGSVVPIASSFPVVRVRDDRPCLRRPS